MWPNILTYALVIVSPNRAEETSETTLHTSTFEFLQDVSCLFSDYILILLLRSVQSSTLFQAAPIHSS